MNGATFLRSHDKRHLLRRIPLFANLSTTELQLIADSTRLVEFKKDEVVYREGDPAGAFYVILSGRLRLFLTAPEGEQTLAFLHRGDSFGEISLLTGETHSATVKVQNDTLLLVLTKDKFEVIIDRIPSLVLYLSRVLSRRLRRRDGRPAEFSEATIVAVHSAVRDVGCTMFAVSLAMSLTRETHQPVVIVDMSLGGGEIARTLGLTPPAPLMKQAIERVLDRTALQQATHVHPLGFSILNVGQRADGRTAELIAPVLTSLMDTFRFVIVDLPTDVDQTVLQALVQSDRIFLLTDAEEDHVLRTQRLRRKLESLVQQTDEKIRLVVNLVTSAQTLQGIDEVERFGGPIAYVLPKTFSQGASLRPTDLLALVERHDGAYAQTVRRIAREVGGVLVGLALGSGAALGLAHIGVLKVLEREKIPIDIIAGSSMGALIAAFWASGKSAAALEELALRFRTRWQLALQFVDVPWLPLRGMFPGKGVAKYLRSVLTDKTFDDTWLPLRVVATNPYMRERIVFRSGKLVDAVRASVSIPGIFLPVLHEGNVYLDGGVSSPVPVSVLRQEGATRVIAVNVFPTTKEVQELDAKLRQAKTAKAEALARRWVPLRIGAMLWHEGAKLVSPLVTHVLMRSMQMMEFEVGEVECQDADVVIRPTTPGAEWDEFYRAERFIQRGEEAANEALPHILQLLHS